MGFLDDYEPVEDRLAHFWEDYPFGRIETFLDHHVEGDYIVRAVIYRDLKEAAAATGYAHDSVTQLPANMKASALEVCETSAIGRALANLGYAPKGKRPSREEMSKSAGSGQSQAAAKTPAPATPGGNGGRVAPDAPPPTSLSGSTGSYPSQEKADEAHQTSAPRSTVPADYDAAGAGGQVGSEAGEGPACPHLQLDPTKPDGKPYPKGYARCTQCNSVEKVTA